MSEAQSLNFITQKQDDAKAQALQIQSGLQGQANEFKSTVSGAIDGVGGAITTAGIGALGKSFKANLKNYLKNNTGMEDEEAENLSQSVLNGDTDGAVKILLRNGINKGSQIFQNITSKFKSGLNDMLSKAGIGKGGIDRGEVFDDDFYGLDGEEEIGAYKSVVPKGGYENPFSTPSSNQPTAPRTQPSNNTNQQSQQSNTNQQSKQDDEEDEDLDDDPVSSGASNTGKAVGTTAGEEGGEDALESGFLGSLAGDENPVGAILTVGLGIATIISGIFEGKKSDNVKAVQPQQIVYQSGTGD